MDVELTRDEEELILFLDSFDGDGGTGCPTLEDLEKCPHVNEVRNTLASLVKKRFVGWGHLRGTRFFRLTDKGKEVIEWM